jgi:DNA-binding IclR family transcriptional regulator
MELNEHETPVATRERVLRILGMTRRPMRWSELTNALGLLSSEVRTACEWLMDHGYIAPTRLANGALRSVEALWTLGDRGIEWARANGALQASPA